jgi:FkbH-like protein
VADAFSRAFRRLPKWQAAEAAFDGPRHELLETEYAVFADYLAAHARGRARDDLYRDLFIGELVKGLHVPNQSPASRLAALEEFGSTLRAALEELLQDDLSPVALTRLDECLVDALSVLEAKDARRVPVLFVGDCLHLDIVAFMTRPLVEAGIAVQAAHATAKDPSVLRDELRALASEPFSVVFYSPYTYEFDTPYAALGRLRMARAPVEEWARLSLAAAQRTDATLAQLVDSFECPIYVHNSSALIRDAAPAKRLLRARATALPRRIGRAIANERLAASVRAVNAQGSKRVLVLDELGVVQQAGPHRAGAYLHRSRLQHPAVLGSLLAPLYADRIFANGQLRHRKVVVCDLDNTLWKGVIGEGEVEHHHDRQALLRDLKARGLVLAICSKNDPGRVHWRGATLAETDFVHAAISWDPKVHGIAAIERALNLKAKDFVFIDDRADELEMVATRFPGVLCLDAEEPSTWRRLQALAESLEPVDMDRTLMYRQREQRESFVQRIAQRTDDGSADADRVELFRELGLSVKLSWATRSDVKRVAELVNRTNQWNLEGSRTSEREVAAWQRSPEHLVVVARTSDRFGDMGVTCVAIAHARGDELVLLPFVLSCRVFGYGIETSVLGLLCDEARARGLRRIVGRYVPTPHNAPCRDFLPRHGFVESSDGCWVSTLETVAAEVPAWLSVELASTPATPRPPDLRAQ